MTTTPAQELQLHEIRETLNWTTGLRLELPVIEMLLGEKSELLKLSESWAVEDEPLIQAAKLITNKLVGYDWLAHEGELSDEEFLVLVESTQAAHDKLIPQPANS